MQGDANGQFELGMAYHSGYGVAENKAEAVRWWHKAAAQGHARAQYSLGSAYLTGVGIAKNRTLAHYWFCRSAAEDEETGLAAVFCGAAR